MRLKLAIPTVMCMSLLHVQVLHFHRNRAIKVLAGYTGHYPFLTERDSVQR